MKFTEEFCQRLYKLLTLNVYRKEERLDINKASIELKMLEKYRIYQNNI